MYNQMMLYQNKLDIIIIVMKVAARTRILMINVLLIDCREAIEKSVT